MRIRYGFRIALDCAQPTPTSFAVDVHSSRTTDIIISSPFLIHDENREPVASSRALDMFGNIRRRAVLPVGRTLLEMDGMIDDSGAHDAVAGFAGQSPIEDLPEEAMTFLLGSRYCETDLLSNDAWSLFGHTPEGWSRVQAICDFVHDHVAFGYAHADCTRSAAATLRDGRGVCRDFAHLAITFCRAMNIPARYCTGYLGDIGVPADPAPMDFSAWFEAYLDGRWYTFDARHNRPRVGRIVMARGRDATDVPIVNTFGAHRLGGFEVWTDEVAEQRAVA
ncbi:transglutaminase-like domain-containing protein [Ancylobacter pratisalsi]|uniref:Transglutaminase family protein n=1 Tax=Ancylobacter pratisalsi TaxID=1745854 RepID=A0A6P1YWG0_9HYPH|nr:transglutaminase family protein [Ancylobacter pratisalsi]QIB35904.1 transglutaminase family protein [Ancylobacter pratisalsi]